MERKWEIFGKKDKEREKAPDQEALDEEYIRRAEELEQKVFADKDFEDYVPTEEQEKKSFHKLRKMIRKIYGPMDEEQLQELREWAAHMWDEEEEPETWRTHLARGAKIAGLVLLSGLCIFAAAMTSEANRTYFINSVRIWTGADTKTVVYNDPENDSINIDEEKAIEEIENTLGIIVPEFYYRPKEFEYVNYEVIKELDIARMEYQYGENLITFLINKETKNTASNGNTMLGKNMARIVADDGEIKISVKEIQDSQDEIQTYVAEWERDGTFYQLVGKVQMDELVKIVEHIKF